MGPGPGPGAGPGLAAGAGPGARRGSVLLLLLLALGHLTRLPAVGAACRNVYQGVSECVLKLGDNMATYEETERAEPQGLRRVCGYWDEFHVCALTALWECRKEAAAAWEVLRRESQRMKFPGSLFELCGAGAAPGAACTRVPSASVLGIPLLLAWLNL